MLTKRLFLLFILSICGFAQAEKMPLIDAVEIVEQLLMTQHQDYKPQGVVFTDDYLGLGYGVKNKGSSIWAIRPNGSYSTVVGDRLYYSDLSKLELSKWRGLYLITVSSRGDLAKHIYRGSSKEDALLFIDAMKVILKERAKLSVMNKYRNDPETLTIENKLP